MDVCVLASGSAGNSICVSSNDTTVLIDAGLSAKELVRRMTLAGVMPEAVCGVLFTHDHDDHCKAIDVFHKKYGTPLFANEGTATAIEHGAPRLRERHAAWTIFENASTFSIGALTIHPFSIPHDAADPVGYVIDDGTARIFIATDLGQATTLVRNALADAQLAILESNHDLDMLMHSDRSWVLKTRIAGRSGHLSNEDAATLITETRPASLKTLLLAHLSGECNTPALAHATMHTACHAIARDDIHIATLSQTEPSHHFTVA